MPARFRGIAAALVRHRDANGLRVRHHDAVPFLHVDGFLYGFTDRALARAGALHGLAAHDVDRHLARTRHRLAHGARGGLLAVLVMADIDCDLATLLDCLAHGARGGPLAVLIVGHVDGDLAR